MDIKILIVVVAITLSGNILAQTVPSSCVGTDSIKNIYYVDAVRLAVKRIYDINSPDTINVTIRQENIDSCLSSLIAVHNATGLQARDTVIDILQIHTQDPVLNFFSIEVDTANPWTTSWKQSVTLTGDNTIDTLLIKYGLTLVDYIVGGSQVFALFQTDSLLNIYALVDSFKLLPGIVDVQKAPMPGDAPNIYYTVQDSSQKLTFRYGWGDCLNGCIYSRYWEFKIYQNCSVEYLGSYGTPLPITSIFESDTYSQSTITIYPNPTIGLITITGTFDDPATLELYDITGRKVTKHMITGNNYQLNISHLLKGFYIYELSTGKPEYLTGKLVKQ